MKKKKFMLLILLLLGVGFAAVSTTLYLNGNVKIATNNEDFDVRFTIAMVDREVEQSLISPDGKTITFGTKNLIKVGNKSILNFEVTNNSEMYDAEVSINCSATGDKSDYYQVKSEVASSIVAKTKEMGKVEVELLRASTEDIQEEFTCTLTATAKERTTKAEKQKYTPKYFALGDPTTSSTTDYETLTYPEETSVAGQQAKVFVGLDADGVQKSVCTLATGNLECFKNNNWEEEKTHMIEAFSEITCSSSSSLIHCYPNDVYCSVNSAGVVVCTGIVIDKSFNCWVDSDGSAECFWG